MRFVPLADLGTFELFPPHRPIIDAYLSRPARAVPRVIELRGTTGADVLGDRWRCLDASEAQVYPERSQKGPGTTRRARSPRICVHQVERAGLEPATPSLQSWLSQ